MLLAMNYYLNWNIKMSMKPNYRKADCCSSCNKSKVVFEDNEIFRICREHEVDIVDHYICDNFERKDDE